MSGAALRGSNSATTSPEMKSPNQQSQAGGAGSPLTSIGQLSLAVERDIFHAVLAESIALLVTHVEAQCEDALSTMPRQNWTPEQTGDQSGFVTAVAAILGAHVPLVRHNLHTSRKYFTR